MTTKKVSELSHEDLGKTVLIEETNGDKNSGTLIAINSRLNLGHISIEVDNASVRAPLDSVVTFTA